MIVSDFYCNDCQTVFDVWVETGESFPEHPECEKCHSTNTRRKWGAVPFDVAEGMCGNAKNDYNRSITYKASRLTPMKTAMKKIKDFAHDFHKDNY